MIKDIDTWEINDGWIPLVTNALTAIEALSDNYEVAQVKEKFGTLRLYLQPVNYDNQAPKEINSQVWDIISAAEKASATTCEICGNGDAETYTEKYWIRTRCKADR